MLRTIFFILLALIIVNSFARSNEKKDCFCPKVIECGINGNPRCYGGMPIDNFGRIDPAMSSYPYYQLDGTYYLARAEGWSKQDEGYSKPIIKCTYSYKDYPAVNFTITSDANYVVDMASNSWIKEGLYIDTYSCDNYKEKIDPSTCPFIKIED